MQGVTHFYYNSTSYAGTISIAACETAASFIINGSFRNLDYKLQKKLGVNTPTHRYKNYITLSEVLSDPNDTSIIILLGQCYSPLHFRIANQDAVTILLKSFNNDLLTQGQCTENAFTNSTLQVTKITDTHFLYNFIFIRLNRRYFSNVAVHIFTSIFSRNRLHEAFVGNNDLIILPELFYVLM